MMISWIVLFSVPSVHVCDSSGNPKMSDKFVHRFKEVGYISHVAVSLFLYDNYVIFQPSSLKILCSHRIT